MTISIQEMKNILSEAIQNNTNSDLLDCMNTDFDCNNLHNTIIGNYPLIGFECLVIVDMCTAISSGIYNQVLDNELENIQNELDRIELDDFPTYLEDHYIDYWIEVTTEYQNNTIKAFCSAGNGKHTLLSEAVDVSSKEAFKAQCERFVSAL